MIELYGIRAPYVCRVRAALIFKALPFAHVDVDLWKPSAEWQRISPTGKIPLLKDSDGTMITDSLNIIDYLDRRYPETYQMLPPVLTERVITLNTVFLANKIYELFLPFAAERFGMPKALGEGTLTHRIHVYTESQKEHARAELRYRVGLAAAELNGREYFGPRFSLADAAMISVLAMMKKVGEETEPLTGWLDKCLADERIAQMYAPPTEKGIRVI